MDQEEFIKAMFGEMNVKENDHTDAVRQLAEYIYCYYKSFMVAGFDEPRAFALCAQILNNILSRK